MKKTTIDRGVLPHIWLTWSTSREKFYLDCDTGVKTEERPKFGYYSYTNRLLTAGSKARFAYAKYHEDIEALELAEVVIDTTRKECKHEWKYSGEKYFLKRDKIVLDVNGNIKMFNYTLSKDHFSRDFNGFLGMFHRISHHYCVEEFKKFLGSDSYTISSGRVVTVTNTWHIQEWYKTKQAVRGDGKQQKLTNKLVAMPVTDIAELAAKYPPREAIDNYYRWAINGLIVFERLDDGWSVLRILNRTGKDDGLVENERMYLHDDGANRIVSPSKDGWVPARYNTNYCNYEIANKEEAMEKCKRLKYIIPHIEEDNKQYVRATLMTILRFPEIEQMISLGYKKAARYICHGSTPRADIKNMFGGYYNEKEKTFMRKVGMNKHQLDEYMDIFRGDNYYDRKCAIAMSEMRKMFGDSLKSLDNTTFDTYFHGFYTMPSYWNRGPFYQLDNMDVDRNKFIRNAIRICKKNNSAYSVLNDTLNGYASLNAGTQPEINWYFDSYSDLVRAHNAIDELRRAQDAERRAMWDLAAAERLKKEEEKRKKIDEERKEYEYEDDDYIIRLPKDLSEIVTEGSVLHICIGGYTTRHAFGQTNLFFLRKKSEPDTPFYAIEMDNAKNIVQIHGFANKWCGNNPEIIPTIVRWLRKNNIKCDTKILTCTAKGYCTNNTYIPMPVVD